MYKGLISNRKRIVMKTFSTQITKFQSEIYMKFFHSLLFVMLGMLSTKLSAQTTYLWNTGATTSTLNVSPTVTTTYYVTITHNGVEYIDSVTIVVNQPSSSEQNVTATSSFTWDVNGQTYTTSGSYVDTLLNAANCDSIVTLNLTINAPFEYDLTQSALVVCEGEEVVLGVSFGAQYQTGYVHCNGIQTAVVDVINPTTGKTWMDRNLGANRVAISSTDAEAYGSLFQWGRFADGHQCVHRFSGDGVTTSNNTALNATVSSDTPPHGDFILRNAGNFDWRTTTNNNLWQGVSGINNPCPDGYRLPTYTELTQENTSWSSNNAVGAFASPLKLPLAGKRDNATGVITNLNSEVIYWSSTVSGTSVGRLRVSTTAVNLGTNGRSWGLSVRCIKE